MQSRMVLILLMCCLYHGALAQNIVVANLDYNVLYVGIPARIDFASKTIPKKQIILTPQRGKITRLEDSGEYYYENCDDNAVGPLTFYARDAKTGKLIDTIQFRLRWLPNPNLIFHAANMKDWRTYGGTNLLRDLYGFRCLYSGDFTDQACGMVGFTLTVADSTGTLKNIEIDGYKIPDVIKMELEIMEGNVSVTAHNFKVSVGCVIQPRVLKDSIKLK